MGSFWSLRNDHTIVALIFIPLIVAAVIEIYYPQYVIYPVAGAFAIIMFVIAGLPLNAYIFGPRYPHLKEYDCEYETGTPVESDVYVDRPDPAGKFPSVWSLWYAFWCTRCKRWRKEEELLDGGLCPKCNAKLEKQEIPRYFGGRWWWTYLVKSRWGVEVPGFKGHLFLHGYVLPYPWWKFFHFAKREYGAWLQGENITHPSSDLCVAAIAPYKVKYLGTEIPIKLGIFATGEPYKAITRDWGQGMAELARMLPKMKQVAEDYKDLIYPEKEITAMVTAFLEQQRRRKVAAPPIPMASK